MKKLNKCCECGEVLRYQTASQTFIREGVEITVSGIPAFICPKCGSTEYTPGTADEVAAAAKSMLSLVSRHGGGKSLIKITPLSRTSRKKAV